MLLVSSRKTGRALMCGRGETGRYRHQAGLVFRQHRSCNLALLGFCNRGHERKVDLVELKRKTEHSVVRREQKCLARCYSFLTPRLTRLGDTWDTRREITPRVRLKA